MAIRRWVVNASPLILLGKTDLLNLLTGLADSVIVPQSVADEVGAKPDGTLTIEALVRNAGWALVKNETVSPEVLAWDLGAGETQVIVAAQRHSADRVVLDDLEARRCAKAMGLKVIGTLGIVARAKRIGRIDLAAPVIQRLRKTGLYVSEDLVEQLLREVGE
jgi:predicted nucleic acid-binding protein